MQAKESDLTIFIELCSTFYDKVTAKHPLRKELLARFAKFK
jgi:hypothetical protein